MKKSKGRLISILTLLFVLVISLVSCLCLLTACSDDTEGEAVKKEGGRLSGLATTDHSYYTSMSTMMSGSHYDSATQTLTLTGSTDKYIYLDDDYTCNIVLEDGAAISLCLHGHTLTGAGGDSVITVKESAQGLVIADCDSTGRGMITGGSGHSVTASDGYSYKEGGAVYVAAGAELEIYGGTITENSANLGGAIFLDDGASLYLGSSDGNYPVITDNTASYSSSSGGGPNGGGIFAKNAAIEMYEGEISNNKAVSSSSKISQYGGGGIFAYNSDVKMYGGVISDNYTDGGRTGAGICLEGSSILTMTDGEIKDNDALGGAGIAAQTGTTLNISGGKITGNDASTYFMGGGLYIDGKATLSNVEISGNYAVYGGGFYVSTSGDVTMGEGTIVSDNEAVDNSGFGLTAQGGGIYVNGGSLTIAGGEISNNSAVEGGGMYVTSYGSSHSPTVTFSGCEISDNAASGDGGGVYLKGKTTFTMNSGSVSYNESAGGNGGGLFLVDSSDGSPVATINGGDVSHNKTYKYGAGVYLNSSATFTLAGGHIDYNEMSSDWLNYTQGAGVYMVSGTSFVMSSGSVSYNKSTTFTGGVHVCSNASFTMTGGEIVGNMACICGGVYLSSSATFTVSGKVVIEGNCDCVEGSDSTCTPSDADELTSETCHSPSDVNVLSNGAITLGGALSGGSFIGIQYNEQGGASEQYVYTQITAAESSTKYYQSSYQYFFLDYEGLAKKYTIYADTSKKCVTIVDFSTFAVYAEDESGQKYGYSSLTNAFSDAGDGYTIYLNSNVSLTSEIEVSNDVTLDLQGHTITTGSSNRAFYVYHATFTLCDSTDSYGGPSSSGTVGTVKNSNGTYTTTYTGYDDSNKQQYYTYTAGAITGMNSSSLYGMVYVYSNGVFNMLGGILCNIKADYGCGVSLVSWTSSKNSGTFNMYGGAISDNTAARYGGAVNIGYYSRVNIYGGILSNNSAGLKGGAIYVSNSKMYPAELTVGAEDYEALEYEVEREPVISGNIIPADDGGDGAGIYVGYGIAHIYNGDIVDNYNYLGNGGGIFVDGDSSNYGTLYLSGGRIMYNNADATTISANSAETYGGGGICSYGKLYLSGDAYVYYNTWWLFTYGQHNSLYKMSQGNIYDKGYWLMEIDPDFDGYVGIAVEALMCNGTDAQFSSTNSAYTTDWVGVHFYADTYNGRGGCIGLKNNAVWAFNSHNTASKDCYRIEYYSTSAREGYALVGYCSQCGKQRGAYWCNYMVGSDGNVYAYYSNSYGYYELKIDEGFFVESSGTLTWYSNLTDALDALSSGDTLYICEDVTGDISVSKNCTINLNGNSVGSITVSGGTVSITGDGEVGTLMVSSGSATLSGGTYSNDIREISNVSVKSGYAILVNGDGTYSVVSESAAKSSSAASVTVDGKTYYFESFEEALEYATENASASNGVAITLYEDISDANIDWKEGDLTIDLNGRELDGEISVSNGASVTFKGSGEVDAKITVDSSGSLNVDAGSGKEIEITLESGSTLEGTTEIKSGSATMDLCGNTLGGEVKVDSGATLTVTGEGGIDAAVTVQENGKLIISADEDGDGIDVKLESGSSVSDMEITSGAVEVDLNGNTIGSLTVGDNDGSTSSNVTIMDLSDGNSGTITSITDSSDGGDTLSFEGGSYSKDQIGTIASGLDEEEYAIVYVPASGDSEGSFAVVDKSEVENAAASVTVTDSEGNSATVYFEDISEAVSYAESSSTSGNTVTITLESDVTDGMEIDSGEIEVDLNGHKIDSLTVGDNDSGTTASVTVTDSSEGEGTISNVTVAEVDGDSLSIQGGSYNADQLDDLSEYLDDDYVFYKDSEGNTYLVSEEDVAKSQSAASVTVTDSEGNTSTVYFEDVEDAIEYAEEKAAEVTGDETTVKVTLYDDVEDVTISSGDIELDLNGHNVDSLTIGDGDSTEGTTVNVTITDSSDEGTGSVSNLVTDKMDTDGGDSLTIEGGTFSEDVSDYLGENSGNAVIFGLDDEGNFTYRVASEEDAMESLAAASITIGNEPNSTTYYFDSIEAAIKYVEENSVENATITLLEDTVMEQNATISSSSITIDLNGHNLEAKITIEADAKDGSGQTATDGAGKGGSLTITDNGTEGTVGTVGGTIKVNGTSTDVEAQQGCEQQNSYANTLVFEGVAPESSKTVDLNLKSNGSDGSNGVDYHFDYDSESGNYSISVGHVHAYTIPVWEKQEDGSYVLKFQCTCGEYETVCSSCVDDETCSCECAEGCTCAEGDCTCEASCGCREEVVYDDVEIEYSYDETTGEVTITMTVTFECGSERATEYSDGITNTITITPAASITVDSDTIYFESVEEALAYAASLEDKENVTIVLMDDVSELTITDGSITIDLNGFEIGTLTVGDDDSSTAAAVTVVDNSTDGKTGTIGEIDVKDESSQATQNSLTIEGGTYTEDQIDEISGYLGEGDTLYSDGTGYQVVKEDDIIGEESSIDAAVKVTFGEEGEETTIYFESIEDAIEYAESLAGTEAGDGADVTITLLEDIEDCDIEITTDNITIDLDGNKLSGDIKIDNDSTLTVTGSGEIDASFDVAAADEDNNKEAGKLVIEADSKVCDEGGIEITLKEGSSFDGEMDIISGDVEVDLNGNELGTLAVGETEGDESKTANVTVTDSSDGNSGTIDNIEVKEGTETGDNGDSLSIQGGTYGADVLEYVDTEGGYAAVQDGNGNYVIVSEDELESVAAVEVTIGDDTRYFSSLQDAIDNIESNGSITEASIKLLGDVEEDITISSGSITIDLNGQSLTSDITVKDGASLTIEDNNNDEKTGSVTGHIEGSSDSVTVKAGTFSEDVSKYLDEDLYLLVDTTNGSYTVVNDTTGAVVKITDAEGNDRYYSSAEAAFADAKDGETITLLGDISSEEYESGIVLSGDGNITLDLNGNTISCDLKVGDDTDSVTLTITDSNTDGSKTGSITGGISTNDYSYAIVAAGTYDSDPRESEGYVTVESGYEVVSKTENGVTSYVVMKTAEAESESAAFVTVGTLVDTGMEDDEGNPIYETVTQTLYFDSVQDAIDYAQKAATAKDDEGNLTASGVTITLLKDVDCNDGITVSSGEITLDLNGHKVSKLTVGDSEPSTVANVTVVDSSEGSGTILSIDVKDEASSGQEKENTLSIEGGTYSDPDEILSYVDGENYAFVSDGEGGYIVTDLESVESVAAASVTTEDDVTLYFEKIASALQYAAENGGTVTLFDDADIRDAFDDDENKAHEITANVTIDLNGHTLVADIVIDAGEGGSLAVTDSSEDKSGKIEGTISVKDSTSPSSGEEDYSETLVFEDGVTPNENLKIDLSELGQDDDNNLYVFEGKEDGTYSISDAASHECSYTIEVWTRDGEKITLKLMCACGKYLSDETTGDTVIFDADGISYTENDNGTVTVTATVTIADEEGVETTYSYEETFSPVASVTATMDGKRTTLYFDDIESAMEYAALHDGNVTLLDDITDDIMAEDSITIGSGNVSLDLNGHTIDGGVTVGGCDEGKSATLTIFDSSVDQSGTITGKLTVTESGDNRLILNGGTFDENPLSDDSSVEIAGGKYVVVGGDDENPTYTVVDSDTAENLVAASVTVVDENGEETTVYFVDIEDALAYAEEAAEDSSNESVTVTLYGDQEELAFDADGDYELDLNGHSVENLTIGGDCTETSVTITDSSEDGSGYVGNLEVAESGTNSAELDGGSYGCDILDMDNVETGDDSYILVGEETVTDEEGNTTRVPTYTVVDEETAQENVAASVTVGDETVYFEDIDDAIEYAEKMAAAAEDDETVKVTLFEDAEEIDFESGNYELDLNGHSVENLTIGGEDTETSVTIKDSSEDGTGYVGNIEIAEAGEEPESSVTVEGGSYGCDILDMDGLETGEDSYILVGEDENGETIYTVTDEKTAQENAAASVTVGDEAVYFEDIDDAIAYAEEMAAAAGDEEIVKVTLFDDVDKIDFTDGSYELDLNGHSVDELVIGDEDEGTTAKVTITDSSEDNSGFVGTIIDNETTGEGESEKKSNFVSIEGGTFGEDVSEYLDEESYGVILGTDENGYTTYTIVDKETIESMAEVTVTFTNEDGEKEEYYFASLEDAIEFAASNDGTITLLDDVEADIRLGVDYGGNLTIDLNGHTLTGDIEINAGSGSTLTITDSSDENTGRIEGTITVSDYSAAGSDDYSSTLVFEDGVTPNGNLDIYLSGLGTDEDGEDKFVFSVVTVTDDQGETSTVYQIVDANSHDHSYTIEVWARENGVLTLKFMCSCGEYLRDENGEIAEYEVEATYIQNQDGTVTITATYTDANGNEYSYSETIEAVASVTVTTTDGSTTTTSTIYFDDLQDAIDYAQENEATVTLLVDADADIVTTSDVTIDLNGHELSGSLDVADGTTTIVDNSDDGTITLDCDITVESGATLVIGNEDGTSEFDIFGSITIENEGTVEIIGSGEISAELEIEGTLEIEAGEQGVEISGNIILSDGEIDASGKLSIIEEIIATEGTTNYIGGENATLDIEGPVYVEEGATLEIEGSGEISSSLSVEEDGTLEIKGTEEGITLSLSENTELEGTLVLDGNVTLALGGNDLDADLEIADNSEIALDGQGGTIKLEDDLETTGTTITVTSDTTVDVAGHELAVRNETVGEGEEATEIGGIAIESGTLTVEDSTFGGSLIGDVTVSSGAEIEIRDDVVGSYERATESEEEEEGGDEKEKKEQTGFTVTFEDVDYVLSSAMDSFGNIYYETETLAEHRVSGCNYDFAEIESFDAATCTLTIEFTCLCGESWIEDFTIGADDYTAYAGTDSEGEEAVVVEIDAFITVTNTRSRVSYTHEITGVEYLPMYEEELTNSDYTYKYTPASCDAEGSHSYTYKGTGVVVTETIPKTHTNVTAHVASSGETYYVCGTCGAVIYSKDGSDSYNVDEDTNTLIESDDLLIYTDASDLETDIENSQTYEDTKDSAMSEAESRMKELTEEMDAESEYAQKIEEIYNQLIEDLESMGYDWQNGDESYMSDALAEIEGILDDALFEMDAVSTCYDISEEVENIYQGFVDTGLYEGATLTELEEVYGEIMDSVGNLNLSKADAERSGYTDYDQYLEDVYERFVAKVIELLNKIRLYSIDADEKAEGAVRGAISSESGFEGDATFSITEIDTFDIEEILSGFTFIDMGTGLQLADEDGNVLTEEQIAEMFEGKEVLAGYAISISSGDMEISVYNGVYTIKILLPEELRDMKNLTIVYVGNDGTVEVYEATVDKDGYIVFETTHFSNYYLIGDEIIAENGYGVSTIVLGIVLIIELVIAAAFLIWYFVKRSATARAKVLWTLLYALVAAAGIAFIVTAMVLYASLAAVITYAILCGVMLVADILLGYLVMDAAGTSEKSYVRPQDAAE